MEKKHTDKSERLRLKHVLQGRRVDDKHLAHQGEEHGQAEGLVGQEAYLEHRLGRRPRMGSCFQKGNKYINPFHPTELFMAPKLIDLIS